ncbi:DUF2510 domain-containing protein [Blastococcus goldschmidtiae]|uniref:DUF2510 domain-containing protein n=1 Tax=Blastococcus goldschmidtiae TaxID=3075546 RepID=A0ABU2K4T6_9ACTN|nr:DUF2510 domain-containing protein [Blastococcus sp. DSM 46792]MDT0275202.1 DUF2510 domain-containing protein [Blastococcus sp. DSM 46792]
MTSSGQPAPPPGWYADPDGMPGMVRWWSGSAWSDVTTPAGPGVAVQGSPVGAAQRPAAPEPIQWSPGPRPGSKPPRRGAWLAVGVLGVVLAVVLALLVSDGGGEDDAVAGRSVLPPPTSQLPSGPSFAPGTVRIVDEAAGIAYPYLGTGWSEYDRTFMYETTTVAGQYFTTQEDTPLGQFIAQVTSGPVAEGFGWSGPGSLPTTVAALADSVRGNYYPEPNERRILRDEPLTVDGHQAHLVEFQLAWDVEGYDASGERAALLLIDVGRPAPALLYISIPNTHAELYGVIGRLIQSVDVL